MSLGDLAALDAGCCCGALLHGLVRTERADCLAGIARISPAALARKIDPAHAPRIFLQYGSPLKPGEIAKDPTHSPVFGERFKELCAERGIPCKVNYGGKAYFGDAFTWLADEL